MTFNFYLNFIMLIWYDFCDISVIISSIRIFVLWRKFIFVSYDFVGIKYLLKIDWTYMSSHYVPLHIMHSRIFMVKIMAFSQEHCKFQHFWIMNLVRRQRVWQSISKAQAPQVVSFKRLNAHNCLCDATYFLSTH